MTNTRENLVKLFVRMEESARAIRESEAASDNMKHFERGQAMAFAECAELLMNNSLFNDIWHIYMEE